MKEPTERFSDRTEQYSRHRPGYPTDVTDLLQREGYLSEETEVADVGAGTGIFTRLLLEVARQVIAVEPNGPMREAATRELDEYDSFRAVDGSAEDTTLPDDSVDLVTAAQAFHWFDLDATRREFRRILRPPHRAALVWNDWLRRPEPLAEASFELCERFGSDFEDVARRFEQTKSEHVDDLFEPGEYQTETFEHAQTFDRESFTGRLLSMSFMPAEDDAAYDELIQAARDVFDAHADGGDVQLWYDCIVSWGTLAAKSS